MDPAFSSEPGYYEDGKFGIRLETVVMAVPAKTQVRKNPKETLFFFLCNNIDQGLGLVHNAKKERRSLLGLHVFISGFMW